ncbi:hypothetical protein C8Q75DRAFT_724560 [Abortiporus biennis]|nr:hypothetical protein C8Q75DRAFT_724560 [Abortiporus biennis]
MTLLAVFAAASPIAILDKRDVFVPPVTYPVKGTVWKSGERQIVTWDTSGAPVNITNPTGFIILRSAGVTTSVVLADNFPILKGHVELTVPLVLTRDDYSIILFGDSGNVSPDFTIEGLTF